MDLQRIQKIPSQRLAPTLSAPLQTIALLSALVFVAEFLHEVLDANNLYTNQHVLLLFLMILLVTWALAETQLLILKVCYAPLKLLRLILLFQFFILLIRSFMDNEHFDDTSHVMAIIVNPKFDLSLVFMPSYLLLFMGVIHFIIKSFTYSEFVKSNQLNSEMINLKLAQSALVESEDRYRMITDWAHDTIWSLDTHGLFVFVSPSIETLTGIRPHELISHSPARILTQSSFELLNLTLNALSRTINQADSSQPYCIELEYLHSSSKVFVTEVTVNFLLNSSGSFKGFVGITRDITERKKIEVELREAKELAEVSNLSLLAANAILHGHATTDQLTGVANRRHFENSLESQVAQCKSLRSPISLIVIDIDNFKGINDCYGHRIGDMVLVESARLFQSNLSKSDMLARWGGDEFILLLSGSSGTQALTLAQDLCEKFRRHRFPVVNSLTASFGVAEFQNSESIENWFSRTDDVLYAAKSAGRNCVKHSH